QIVVSLVSGAIAEAPGELLPRAPAEVVLKVHVRGVEIVRERRGREAGKERRIGRSGGEGLREISVVVIDLHTHGRPARGRVRPAAEHVGARATRLAVDAVRFGAVIEIALQGEAVRCRGLRVQAESAAAHVRRIGGVGAGAGDLIGVFRVLAVDTELDIGRRRGAEADARLLPQLLAAAPRDIKTLCVPGGAGNDVDDAIDRVGTPQRAAGTADDFDAVDVFEEVVLHVPD